MDIDTFTQPFLDALDGVSYLVDAEGRLLAMGQPGWDAFAQRNGAGHIGAQALAGHNLFDAIIGEEVRDSYRNAHRSVLTGERSHIAFEFRCDAPEVKRTMRMAITVLRRPATPAALLYQSQTLSVVSRPWVSLFEPERIAQQLSQESGLPIVRICSLCQRVASPAPPASSFWVEADEYYRMGGPADVRTSHGLCPECAPKL
jgi:hypothetical protein